MALPVVASSSTKTDSTVSSTVVTFPSGLAAGDEMIINTGWSSIAQGVDRTMSTPAGWTSRQNSQSDRTGLAVFTKTASAGDVSAGNVTLTLSGAVDYVSSSILRITGAVAGSVISGSEIDSESSPTGASPSYTTALTPASKNSLVIVSFMSSVTTGAAGVATISSYTSTPALSFTEYADLGQGSGGSDIGFGVATAPTADLTQITSRGATFSKDMTRERHGAIVIYTGSADALGTSSFTTASPEFFVHTARALIVTTDSATNLDFIAEGNGSIIAGADLTTIKRGFVYGATSLANPGNTSPDLTSYTGYVEESGTFIDEAYLLSLSGYPENVTVYVRAFAQTSENYAYGNEVSFASVFTPKLYRWYPHGEGTINAVAQTGNQGNVYSLVKILPEMATVKHIDIRCLPTSSTGSTVIGTVKYYFNHSTTPAITKSITLSDAKKGYDRHEINMPYINAVQIEIEFNTTQTLGADDFHPYTAVVHYEPTNTASKDGG